MSKPYRVLYQEIDGSIEDRETGWPKLELEMHPLGTEYDPSDQGIELVVRIRGAKTVLSYSGIMDLQKFLEMRPNVIPAEKG